MTNKLIRNCIICGSDKSTEIFSYTFEFMVEVRGSAPQALRTRGFGDDESSTVVKCGACGCNFIKDVLLDYQTASAREHDGNLPAPQSPDDRKSTFSAIFSSKRINNNLRLVKIFEQAVGLARAAGGKEIKVLDFGAGSAGFSNLARVTGADLVVSYDLAYDDSIQAVFDAVCADGIVATNDLDVVASHGPYNVIFCQSMIEHVTDPRAVLESLKANLDGGGVIYINNPVMNLDKEAAQLRAATKIVKKDVISYYHPGHLNYMMPRHFIRLYEDCGLSALPRYPEPLVVPKGSGAAVTAAHQCLHQLKKIAVRMHPTLPRTSFFLTNKTR